MSVMESTHLAARNGHTGFVARLIEATMAWNDARVTRNALAKLSERELNDIGLTRFDVDAMSR